MGVGLGVQDFWLRNSGFWTLRRIALDFRVGLKEIQGDRFRIGGSGFGI